MKILYVASEALPFAASGGLGDVMGSLPAAVRSQLGEGSDVRVVLPLYPSVRERFGDRIAMVAETQVALSWRRQYCGIWSCEKDGVLYYFIDNEFYFKRGSLYGNFDDGERFAFFCKAVMEMMSVVGFFPDIMHANDWQSALAVVYLKRKYGSIPGYAAIRTLYTIHNIEYQGVYDFAILGDVFELSEWDRGTVDYNGLINLSKGAITVSDRVGTVSETYAKEILTPYYSHGLSYVLQTNRDKLCGIVNGIDVSYYDPATDPDIRYHYDDKKLDGKAKDKALLQEKCGFAVDPDVPVIAMISRLVAHKGFDLVCTALEDLLLHDNVQVVLLGTGDAVYEDYFRSLAARYPDRFAAMIEFNKSLSKMIYAGADIFLMPSRSEPCGLAQMIASRYGTVAVVRETGGLYDTIRAYNKFDNSGNGFSFANCDAWEMLSVLRDAIALYADKKKWRALMRRAMRTDFSWNASAAKYIELYRSMIG